MSNEHNKMVKALQEIVVTKLRERGFRGSFPHFRRQSGDKIDLLTFQFDRHGGGFFIEIANCPSDGIVTYWGEHIPPNKVRAWDIHPDKRLRLQSGLGDSTSDWFRYDKPGPAGNVFKRVAKKVLPRIEEAEKWWKNDKQ